MPEDIGFIEFPKDRALTREEVEVSVDRTGMPIDPKILPLIVDLNEEGFRTTASCEGDTPDHPWNTYKEGGRNCAWIAIDFRPDMVTKEVKERLKTVIKEHTDVPYKIESRGYKEKGSVIIDFKRPL